MRLMKHYYAFYTELKEILIAKIRRKKSILKMLCLCSISKIETLGGEKIINYNYF